MITIQWDQNDNANAIRSLHLLSQAGIVRQIVKADEVFFVIDDGSASQQQHQPQLLASYQKRGHMLRWHDKEAAETLIRRTEEYKASIGAAIAAGMMLLPEHSTVN